QQSMPELQRRAISATPRQQEVKYFGNPLDAHARLSPSAIEPAPEDRERPMFRRKAAGQFSPRALAAERAADQSTTAGKPMSPRFASARSLSPREDSALSEEANWRDRPVSRMASWFGLALLSLAALTTSSDASGFTTLPSHGPTQLRGSSGNGTVYILRHGEKVWMLGCENAQGLARAQNLIHVFNGMPSTEHETFPKPKAVFANWYHDPVDCERCNQTMQPLAQANGLQV
ncbi:unnamed protein product, partial [Polarella glacialis]